MKTSKGIKVTNSLIEGRTIVQKSKKHQPTCRKKPTRKLSPG